MCKALLVGSFDEQVRNVFFSEQTKECATAGEAQTFLKQFSPEFILIQNGLPDGNAIGHLFQWSCDGDVQDGVKVVIMGFDGELPQKHQMEKIDVRTISGEEQKSEKLREILTETNNPSAGTTTLYFLRRLDVVKMHVQKTREALENGLNQKGSVL